MLPRASVSRRHADAEGQPAAAQAPARSTATRRISARRPDTGPGWTSSSIADVTMAPAPVLRYLQPRDRVAVSPSHWPPGTRWGKPHPPPERQERARLADTLLTVVEVPGIEPGSSGGLTGLLRA